MTMPNEEFERWAISRGCDVSMTDCNNPIYMQLDVQGCWLTWQARQPEIDALKAEVDRLRADAERYHYWRATTSAITNSKGERISTEGMPPEVFDEITDAAMSEEDARELHSERWKALESTIYYMRKRMSAPQAQDQSDPRLVSYALDFSTCTISFGGVEMYFDIHVDSPAQEAESVAHANLFQWCHPGDRQEQRWLLMFDDRDRGYNLYEVESDAIRDFNRAEGGGWNCHLFTSVPRTHPTNDELRQAAGELCKYVMDVHKPTPHSEMRTLAENLRAALGKKS